MQCLLFFWQQRMVDNKRVKGNLRSRSRQDGCAPGGRDSDLL